MSESWSVRAEVPREVARAALVAHETLPDWPPDWVLVGGEIAEEAPGDWFVEAFLPVRPAKSDLARIAALFGEARPHLAASRIVEQDWLAVSQQGLEPIVAGPFRVRTPDHPADGGTIDLLIPAAQAFGTGHHATTAGCLAMLARMRSVGIPARRIADIGTGTGVLAFAALHLWPRSSVTASDIDPVCAQVVAENAALNSIPLGPRAGEVLPVIAAGMAHPLLEARGPYDLLIANILAGPLAELASDFARAVRPGGNVLLAGLLETQEPAVRRAYARAGFRLAARQVRGDWSILWLRRRRTA